MSPPVASCCECSWTRVAQGAEPESLAEALVDLEDHLAGEHDISWPRAHEIAQRWARETLVQTLDAHPSDR